MTLKVHVTAKTELNLTVNRSEFCVFIIYVQLPLLEGRELWCTY